MNGHLGRRRLLQLGGAAAIAGGGWMASRVLGGSGPPSSLGPDLAPAFDDPDAVARLGRDWLAQLPVEQASLDALWRWVHGAVGTTSTNSATDVLAGAQARAVTEYAANRTVHVDGWLLAAIQANVAALVAHERQP